MAAQCSEELGRKESEENERRKLDQKLTVREHVCDYSEKESAFERRADKTKRLTRHHSNLVVDGSSGPNEASELFADRSLFPPTNQRVEDNLVTSWQHDQP